MKIKKSHEMKVVITFMVLILSFFVTLVATLINFGIDEFFFLRWMKSWAIAFVIALPIALIAMPNIKKFVAKYVE